MPKPFYLYVLEFPNGKKYIGLSNNPKSRLRIHMHNVRKNARHSPIYNAIRKYGKPEMRVLCVGNKDYISELEIKTIEAFRTRDRAIGYNVSPGGELGTMMNPEVVAKVAAALRGRPRPPEVRAKVSAGLTGKIQSAETRAKRSATHKGRTKSPEWRAKIGAAHKGRPKPPETRAKLAAANHAQFADPVKRERHGAGVRAWAARRASQKDVR